MGEAVLQLLIAKNKSSKRIHHGEPSQSALNPLVLTELIAITRRGFELFRSKIKAKIL